MEMQERELQAHLSVGKYTDHEQNEQSNLLDVTEQRSYKKKEK